MQVRKRRQDKIEQDHLASAVKQAHGGSTRNEGFICRDTLLVGFIEVINVKKKY